MNLLIIINIKFIKNISCNGANFIDILGKNDKSESVKVIVIAFTYSNSNNF